MATHAYPVFRVREDGTTRDLLSAIETLGGDLRRCKEMDWSELEMYLEDLRY